MSYEANDPANQQSVSQDQYMIAENYILYVVKDEAHELVLLFENKLDIEQVAEISVEFDEFLRGLLKRDYVYSVSAHQR